MGQAKRRGSIEERIARAVERDKETQKQRDLDADRNYDSERPYGNKGMLPLLYLQMMAFASGLPDINSVARRKGAWVTR
jgi:hypothetical protein